MAWGHAEPVIQAASRVPKTRQFAGSNQAGPMHLEGWIAVMKNPPGREELTKKTDFAASENDAFKHLIG